MPEVAEARGFLRLVAGLSRRRESLFGRFQRADAVSRPQVGHAQHVQRPGQTAEVTGLPQQRQTLNDRRMVGSHPATVPGDVRKIDQGSSQRQTITDHPRNLRCSHKAALRIVQPVLAVMNQAHQIFQNGFQGLIAGLPGRQ